jgi:hypothetical protein
VEGNGHTPSDVILCGRCETACDSADRFCRQCGLHLHDSTLPSLWDEPKPPATWSPAPTSLVVRGAAIVAAGTIAEILLRNLVRGMLGPRGGNGKEQAGRAVAVVDDNNGSLPDTEVVTETFLLRRVRFRR